MLIISYSLERIFGISMSETRLTSNPIQLLQKLWIYTNYDCNLCCPYCVARSSPEVPRRAIGLANVKKLVDEALALGFEHLYFTGGEPFILNDIYEMLAYASAQLPVTVLSNGMLSHGTRLEKLRAVQNDNLIMQISLDGACPEQHDPYRGAGTWIKTVEGVKTLLRSGFAVRLATTATPAHAAHLQAICEFHQSLNIPEEHHFIRPLARRGNSLEGLEVGKENLLPEITVDVDGAYWHPLTTEVDMLVSKSPFSLACVVEKVQEELAAFGQSSDLPVKTFK
jgi:MoaA/NifB/PqqE/SkfB family radical SAM enzyme